ncbi:transporter [Marinobacterium sp. YM272]|uniref:transporter n=1 Tax=Marinobacterium sp. YM272 TaxID=3421654 RepID=UPI003D7F7421
MSQQAFAIAETVHPRDYIPAPAGVNLSVTYFDHRSGDDVYADGDKVAKNGDLEANAVIERLIHFTELFGMPADPQIIIPVVDLDVGIQGQDSSGLGDIFIGSTFWPVADQQNREWFGLTPFVYLPTGEYDDNQAVNVGANRYSFVLQSGYVKGLTDNLYLDIVGEVQWYGDNDDFLGSNTLSKDEAYRLSAMLSYDLSPASYVWGRYAKQIGGEESLNGITLANSEMDTDTASIGYTRWLGKSLQVQAEYTRDLSVDNGIAVDGATLRLVVPF